VGGVTRGGQGYGNSTTLATVRPGDVSARAGPTTADKRSALGASRDIAWIIPQHSLQLVDRQASSDVFAGSLFRPAMNSVRRRRLRCSRQSSRSTGLFGRLTFTLTAYARSRP
jgi:hypothetical protein